MIDSIKIILRDFSGDLKNCIPKPSRKLIENPGEKEYDNYRLPNRAKSDRHYLTINHALKTNTIKIVVFENVLIIRLHSQTLTKISLNKRYESWLKP